MENADKRNDISNSRRFSSLREFRTNIPPLDRLLGYRESLNSGTGIYPGDIIVIRGGPGSGKTTLGLQIISSYLASDECRFMENNPAAIFLSLETDPKKAIRKVKRDYNFFKDVQRPCLIPVNLKQTNRIIDKLGRRFSRFQLGHLEKGLLKSITKSLTYPLGPAGIFIEEPTKEMIEPVVTRLVCFFKSLIKNQKVETPQDDSSGGILFIDSINALLAMVRQQIGGGEWEPRLVLKHACELLKSIFGKFVILASSEFHHESSWIPAGISESFLSDAEISLTNEPIAAPLDYKTGQQGSVGYNIFKIIEKVQGEEGTKLESRSFIRVLKNRNGANLSRRCAYDIVSGSGIQFYETYPADGHILLFSENPMQKQVWDTFFKEDLPQIYPALRYEAFGRYGLQRIFLNQRRSRYVPIRTDMYVSSFDNYWINWHGELCWRRAIVESVESVEQIQELKDKQSAVAELSGKIHTSLMREPKKLNTILTVQLPGASDKDKKEVLTAFASLSRRKGCIKCFLCRSCWRILTRIAEEDSNSFNEAFKSPKSILHTLINPLPKTIEIRNIWLRIWKHVIEAECCESSPIILFDKEIGINQKNAAEVISDLKKTVYKNTISPDKVEEYANKIYLIFSNKKDILDNLSDEIEQMAGSLKSKIKREHLKIKLLKYAEMVNEVSESKITGILRDCFAEESGCECMVEFYQYLKLTSACDKINEYKTGGSNKIEEILNALFDDLPSMLLNDKGDNQGDISVIEFWEKCTGQKKDSVSTMFNLIMIYYECFRKRNIYHFLSSMPNEKLRLFGERRTTVIEELEESSPEDNRPIHRPGLLFSLRDRTSFIAVPYDANISFMVCRHDILKKYIRSEFVDNKTKINEYAAMVWNIYNHKPTEITREDEQNVPSHIRQYHNIY
jgi:hypothetical protein